MCGGVGRVVTDVIKNTLDLGRVVACRACRPQAKCDYYHTA